MLQCAHFAAQKIRMLELGVKFLVSYLIGSIMGAMVVGRLRGGVDIRLEAAMAKLFNSEVSLKVADLTLQLRGGRGYEQEGSLKGRGEIPFPVERIYRDVRINTIVEGTTDVMHLFIAREALDPHLRKAGALIDPRSSGGEKARSFLAAAGFYPWWYVTRWVGLDRSLPAGTPSELVSHLRFVSRSSRQLARTLFHSMVTVGPALERRQELLARYVDIGVDLLAMTATVSLATSRMQADGRDRSPVELADHFCRTARRRVTAAFRAARSNDDRSANRVAKGVLELRYDWLEEGILPACPEAGGGSREAGSAPRAERAGSSASVTAPSDA